MKAIKIISFVFAVFFDVCFAQIRDYDTPISYSAKQYLTMSSSITDSSRYNSYDFAGNPLGNLDRSTDVVELKTGYRFLQQSEESKADSASRYNGFVLPSIILRPSPLTNLSFNYALQPTEANKLSMPLHQFGFSFVAQTVNGIFQGGIAGQGFIGTEKQDTGSNSRVLMGVKDVGICIGSKVSPSIKLGLYAHAAGYLDTLSATNDTLLQERFASVNLPQIDATMDINMQNVPCRADISYTYAKKHFVYTEKSSDNGAMKTFHDIAGDSREDQLWDADPLVNDSMNFSLQNMWRINFGNNSALMPSLALGYMQNKVKRMKPGSDNKPFSYNGQNNGYEWQTKSFSFGLGSSVLFSDVSRLWIEFYRSSLNLSLDGEKYADSLRDSKFKGFYRVGCGTQLNLSKIAAFNINSATDISLIVGYLYDQQNKLLSTYRGEAFEHVLPMTVNTQLMRYTPWKQFTSKINSSSIHAGLRTAFKEQTFITDLYFVYSSNSASGIISTKTTGIETGLDFTYNCKARSLK